MRTLQRLRHLRPVYGPDEGGGRRDGFVVHEEKRRWRKRLRVLTLLAVLVAVSAGALLVADAVRLVGEAVVATQPLVLHAPGRVRVAEVFHVEGESFAEGEPLLRLESVASSGQRARLAHAVERRRLLLELYDSGVPIDVAGAPRERDPVAEARHAAAQVRAEREAAEARLDELEARQSSLRLAQARLAEESEGRVLVLEERWTGAEAELAHAQAALEPARFHADATRELWERGLLSRRDLAETRADFEEARYDVQERGARARSLLSELDNARELRVLSSAELEALETEIAAQVRRARLELDALDARAELWDGLAAHYRALGMGSAPDPARRTELERALLEAELAEARAELAALEGEVGHGTLVADGAGTIDLLHVCAGSVVDAGAPLVAYFDRSALRVVAYLPPSAARQLADGAPCTLIPEGGGPRVHGTVAALGGSLVPCPSVLRARRAGQVDLRVPVVVECPVATLRPNARFKVVFEGQSKVERARRALGGLLRF